MVLQPGVHLCGKVSADKAAQAGVRSLGKHTPFVRAKLALMLGQKAYEQKEYDDNRHKSGYHRDL